jgi:hypothetical protein
MFIIQKTMSTSIETQISKIINQKIVEFISQISDKTSMEESELLEMWSNIDGGNKLKPKVKKADSKADSSECPEFDPNMPAQDLLKYKKDVLQHWCRLNNKRTTGTKQQLVEILLNKDIDELSDSDQKKITKKPAKPATNGKKTDKGLKTPAGKLVAKQASNTLTLRKNAAGLFVDSKSGFVFNSKTHEAYGKIDSDQKTVHDLTEKDIEFCKVNKWKYVIPTNLDSAANLESEVVEELPDDKYGSDEESENDVDDGGSSVSDVEDLHECSEDEYAVPEGEDIFD